MLIRVHRGDEVKSVSIEHDDLISGLRKRSFPKSEGVMTILGGSDPIDPAGTIGDAGLTHRAEVQIVGGTCCACWPVTASERATQVNTHNVGNTYTV